MHCLNRQVSCFRPALPFVGRRFAEGVPTTARTKERRYPIRRQAARQNAIRERQRQPSPERPRTNCNRASLRRAVRIRRESVLQWQRVTGSRLGQTHLGHLGAMPTFASQKKRNRSRYGLFCPAQVREQGTRHIRRVDETKRRLIGEVMSRFVFVRMTVANDGDMTQAGKSSVELRPSLIPGVQARAVGTTSAANRFRRETHRAENGRQHPSSRVERLTRSRAGTDTRVHSREPTDRRREVQF